MALVTGTVAPQLPEHWLTLLRNCGSAAPEYPARDLLEIIHSRHKKASTIFCSQFAPAGWHAKIGETTLADAILDRIVYDSYTIEIHCDGNEPSMREVYGIKT